MSLRLPGLNNDDPIEPVTEHESQPSGNTPLTSPFASGGTDTELGGGSSGRLGAASRHSGLIVMIAVVIAAAGALYGMRAMGMRGSLQFVDIKIDYPIDSATNIVTADHVKVIDDLRSTDAIVQVPLEEVQMNPFQWRGLQSTETVRGALVDPEAAARRERERRLAAIETAAKRLVLNSIIGGRVPVARISGQLVRVGDTTGEYFRVKSIGGRVVELVADDRVYTLTLGE